MVLVAERNLSTVHRYRLRAVEPDDFAMMLLATTGSDAHVQRLTQYASDKRSAFAVPDWQRLKPCASRRREIYSRLRMQYVPPELREDQGRNRGCIGWRSYQKIFWNCQTSKA